MKEEHRLKEENERLRLMVQEMLAQERSRSNSASMCVFLHLTLYIREYSKTCFKQPLKIDKTKILMENNTLMEVKSIAECSPVLKTNVWCFFQVVA